MIDVDVFEKPYFDNNNWIQIWFTVSSNEELAIIFQNVQRIISNNNWYFFYKKHMAHIKMLVYRESIQEVKALCKVINESAGDCIVHTFEPEYYQFGGECSWNYLVKWFNACTKISFLCDCRKEESAYSVILELLGQLEDNEKKLTIDNLRKIRMVSAYGLREKGNTCMSIIDVKEYKTVTANNMLYQYYKVWPYVIIFILNIFRLNLKEQKKLIEAL